MKDKDHPIIDRIRAARHRISERCGNDPAKLVEHYMELQERHRDRFIKDAPDRKRRKVAVG